MSDSRCSGGRRLCKNKPIGSRFFPHLAGTGSVYLEDSLSYLLNKMGGGFAEKKGGQGLTRDGAGGAVHGDEHPDTPPGQPPLSAKHGVNFASVFSGETLLLSTAP